jgi:hypothetical protein
LLTFHLSSEKACRGLNKLLLHRLGSRVAFVRRQRCNTTHYTVTTSKKVGRQPLPDIIFYPSDEEQFKNELLKTQKAHFVLTYQSGMIKTSPWTADHFEATSNLRANIQSKPFWRKKKQEGLVKVEVYID